MQLYVLCMQLPGNLHSFLHADRPCMYTLVKVLYDSVDDPKKGLVLHPEIEVSYRASLFDWFRSK
jgi:hypothetical protein